MIYSLIFKGKTVKRKAASWKRIWILGRKSEIDLCRLFFVLNLFIYDHLFIFHLIFFGITAGKILSDETKISDCNIDPKKFVVVMVSKSVGAPSAANSSTSAKSTSSSSASTSDKPTER